MFESIYLSDLGQRSNNDTDLRYSYVFIYGLRSRKTGLSPQYFNTDCFKAVLLLWFLIVTCSCCLYLYLSSAIMLVTYFSKF